MQYLMSALVWSDAQATEGRAVFRPTLALAGQGLELMLKACMLWNGKSPPLKGPQGHAIQDFWEDEVCEPVRGNAFANAEVVAEELRLAGSNPSDKSLEGDLIELVDKYVASLAGLHAAPYELRYPGDPATEGPRTPWFVRVLYRTADDFLKNPSDFKLRAFPGDLQVAHPG
ncbi:MAG: hypothetical protein VX569_00550 [Pseudomonadota bacterium]|nr:hypothetical protein [Pseudomonadota bacterium]